MYRLIGNHIHVIFDFNSVVVTHGWYSKIHIPLYSLFSIASFIPIRNGICLSLPLFLSYLSVVLVETSFPSGLVTVLLALACWLWRSTIWWKSGPTGVTANRILFYDKIRCVEMTPKWFARAQILVGRKVFNYVGSRMIFQHAKNGYLQPCSWDGRRGIEMSLYFFCYSLSIFYLEVKITISICRPLLVLELFEEVKSCHSFSCIVIFFKIYSMLPKSQTMKLSSLCSWFPYNLQSSGLIFKFKDVSDITWGAEKCNRLPLSRYYSILDLTRKNRINNLPERIKYPSFVISNIYIYIIMIHYSPNAPCLSYHSEYHLPVSLAASPTEVSMRLYLPVFQIRYPLKKTSPLW